MRDPRITEYYPFCAQSPEPAGCELVHEPVCWQPEDDCAPMPPDPCNNPMVSGYFGMDEDEVDYLLWRIDAYSIEDRLECVSRSLLGTPYEVLDCITYIEETMALSSGAHSFDQYIGRLSDIRYVDGVNPYGIRRNFVSIDWLPENEELGYVRDISRDVTNEDLEFTTLEIDRIAWVNGMEDVDIFAKIMAEWDFISIGKELPEYAVMGYVPFSAFYSKRGDEIVPNEGLIESLPDISVVLLVRPQRYAEKYGTIVAHMGFLVFSKNEDGSRGELNFRHASSRIGMITEEPFLSYIDSQSKYRAGVTILEILEHEEAPPI